MPECLNCSRAYGIIKKKAKDNRFMEKTTDKKVKKYRLVPIPLEIISLVLSGLYLVLFFVVIFDFRHPRITYISGFIIGTFIMLLPFLIYLLLGIGKIVVLLVQRGKAKKVVFKIVATVLTALLINLSVSFVFPALLAGMFMSVDSYTTDFKDYGVYDKDVSDAGLLPEYDKIESYVEKNATYYYNHTYFIDPTHDIYLSFIADGEFINTEKERVDAIFKSVNERYYDYTVIDKNGFTCMILHEKGTPLFEELDDSEHSYDYSIYAYNESTKEVRYISTYCMDIVNDVPYYLQLEW